MTCTNDSWNDRLKDLDLLSVPKFSQIRVETTNNCGYNCFMCPRSKMTRPKGVMSIDDLKLLIDRFDYIKYEVEFHLHGYGETLLCDDFPGRLKLITNRKPNFSPLIITTLGYHRPTAYYDDMFASGLQILTVSLYGYDAEMYKAVHGVDRFALVCENLKTIARLKTQYDFISRIQLDEFENTHPAAASSNAFSAKKNSFISFLKDLGFSEQEIIGRTLHNFGNSSQSLPFYRHQIPCSICWGYRRTHLQVTWDMDVVPCCFDYNSTMVWGNLKEQTLEDIFASQQRSRLLIARIEQQAAAFVPGLHRRFFRTLAISGPTAASQATFRARAYLHPIRRRIAERHKIAVFSAKIYHA